MIRQNALTTHFFPTDLGGVMDTLLCFKDSPFYIAVKKKYMTNYINPNRHLNITNMTT